ncbi:hypothetical protein H6P81_007522 [Aristolochia fimbriata]|uniref:Transmembrane protein n=1 Tax=Aristolochia fimbriata TaxID=158543 RepID=A0AAV7F0T6_ARIFI|nr:hypothetical protein H6P81_007522 [Aristolochia fimbriata]
MAAPVALSSHLPVFVPWRPRLSSQSLKQSLHSSPALCHSPFHQSVASIALLPSSHKFSLKNTRIRRTSATSTDALPSETAADTSPLVAFTEDSVSSSIISVLFFLAFVALSILTIGVIYIGVSDFLQKREREKIEKEEEAKAKKGGKKKKARARTGPRGFGQKIEEEED